MYESFFGLKKKPFELAPNPDFLYLSKSHAKAITYFDYALREKAGFILLTGDAGSGKTTLVRDFINKLDTTVTLAKVFNTGLNAEQLISMINEDFGLDSKDKDKVLLLKELYQFLIEEYRQGRHAVLIIDEAQNLTPPALEEIRMLSNLETDQSKLLQIILVGQPELAEMLSLFELRQLRQRISVVCQLTPLSRPEIEEYISHRLEVAGNREAVKFSTDAFDHIHQFTHGIPRLVNIIGDFVLLTAFTESIRDINAAMVDDIVNELKIGPQYTIADDSLVKKRALLSALGVSNAAASKNGNPVQTEAAPVDEKWGILLRNMNHRVSAVEKECERLESVELAEIRKKLEMLERAQRDRSSHQYITREQPARPLTIPDPSASGKHREQPKAGLLRRLFGAE